MRAVKEKANAKINLFLDVVSRREDGFHDIKSVMHSVSLSDEITVLYTPSSVTSIKMYIKGSRFLPPDDRNLAYRAAKLYLERAHKTANIEIRLAKRIPIAAGLAGGSADAAATLRAMNRIFDKLFSEKALLSMASELGSDVPYCLYGKTALCEGCGNIMTKLPDNLKLSAVIAIADERVSTPSAYSALDEMYSSFDGSIPTDSADCYHELIESIQKGKFVCSSLFNIFESAVLPKCPRASAIKKRMCELGAKAALMSGSGPSIFGIFETAGEAKAVADALRLENITAFAVESI